MMVQLCGAILGAEVLRGGAVWWCLKCGAVLCVYIVFKKLLNKCFKFLTIVLLSNARYQQFFGWFNSR